ncbi:MAG: hypothetical protein N3A53_05180, partial [Verrucomicrobiae bacterium]|nr:hypothetical protein [Verrucomicrobiae bacterium]
MLVLVSIIVIVASLISIYLSMRTPQPKINTMPFVGIGEVAAEQAVKLLDGRGEIVLVALQLEQAPHTIARLSADTFRDRLRKYPQVRISAVEAIKPASEIMLGYGILWKPEEFLDSITVSYTHL